MPISTEGEKRAAHSCCMPLLLHVKTDTRMNAIPEIGILSCIINKSMTSHQSLSKRNLSLERISQTCQTDIPVTRTYSTRHTNIMSFVGLFVQLKPISVVTTWSRQCNIASICTLTFEKWNRHGCSARKVRRLTR